MADFFDQQPNFSNEAYATPAQLAASRAYADVLLKRAGQPVNRPAGAIAAVIDTLTGNLERNRANQVEQQAAAGNARDYSTIVSQQQSGQKLDPEVIGRLAANPMASPEARAFASKLITPETTTDMYGKPATYSAAAGLMPSPVGAGLTPGVRSETTVSPDSIRGQTFTPAPAAGQPPQATTPVMGGGMEGAIDTMGRLRLGSARSGAVSDFTKADLAAANDAPTIKRVAGVMLDDLQRHGDRMTFGPTAEWSNTIKRAVTNYAPGLMKDQMEALASADSFDKMHSQLSSLLAKTGGGTDAQLFNSMRSVPGAHNSKEGAEALLKMTLQVADQQQALQLYTRNARTPDEYLAAKNKFYADNPIINPITRNPIRLDLERQTGNDPAGGGAGRSRILRVHD